MPERRPLSYSEIKNLLDARGLRPVSEWTVSTAIYTTEPWVVRRVNIVAGGIVVCEGEGRVVAV